jgi:hypothetical protein
MSNHFILATFKFQVKNRKVLKTNCMVLDLCAWIAHLVWRLATGLKVRGSSPVWKRFPALFQARPGAHPASYKWARVLSRGIKWPGHGVDQLSTSRSEVIEKVELHIYSTSGPSWPVTGWTLPLESWTYQQVHSHFTYLLTPWSRVLLEKLTSELCS